MRKFHVNRLAPAALLLMAVLWGSTLVVLKDLVPVMGTFDLTFVRFTIASIALVLIAPRALRMERRTIVEGALLGSLFAVGSLLQTFGLATVDASVSGFLTGLYVIFTPILGWLIFGRRVPGIVWAAVVLSTIGIAVLSLKGGASAGPGLGDALTIASAAMFALHIIATGRVVTPKNAVSLSLVQAITIAAVTSVAAVPGGVHLPQDAGSWTQLLYLAVICGAIPLVGQVWAQSHVEPNRAAIIMGTEPVWGALIAVAFGGELLNLRLVVGGAIICLAIWLVVKPRDRRRGTVAARRGRGAVTAPRKDAVNHALG